MVNRDLVATKLASVRGVADLDAFAREIGALLANG